MSKTYIFQSERLGFRNWLEKDLEPFIALNADEEVMEHFTGTRTKEEVQDLIRRLKEHYEKHGFTYYAVEVLETQEFIGMIGIAQQDYKSPFTPAVDIGWRLKRSAWGKGYATEGAKRCLDYAFTELELDKIIAICTVNNSKSENVMRKLGMKKVGAFNHPELSDFPEYEKHFCYEIRSN